MKKVYRHMKTYIKLAKTLTKIGSMIRTISILYEETTDLAHTHEKQIQICPIKIDEKYAINWAEKVKCGMIIQKYIIALEYHS